MLNAYLDFHYRWVCWIVHDKHPSDFRTSIFPNTQAQVQNHCPRPRNGHCSNLAAQLLGGPELPRTGAANTAPEPNVEEREQIK